MYAYTINTLKKIYLQITDYYQKCKKAKKDNNCFNSTSCYLLSVSMF